jgi:hypothetical protein
MSTVLTRYWVENGQSNVLRIQQTFDCRKLPSFLRFSLDTRAQPVRAICGRFVGQHHRPLCSSRKSLKNGVDHQAHHVFAIIPRRRCASWASMTTRRNTLIPYGDQRPHSHDIHRFTVGQNSKASAQDPKSTKIILPEYYPIVNSRTN